MKKLLTLFIMLMFSAGAWAQVDNPVKWSYASKKVNNKEAVVFLKVAIDKGWHIYSQYAADGGQLKTSFTFSPSKNYKLMGKTIQPKSISKYEPVLKLTVNYFQNAVIFQQKVKLISAQASVIKGKLEYIACNDHRCNPPEELEFNIPLSN
jgi:hypothetical protein